jgi:hypothetical protein
MGLQADKKILEDQKDRRFNVSDGSTTGLLAKLGARDDSMGGLIPIGSAFSADQLGA